MLMVSVVEESLRVWNSDFTQLLFWFGSAMHEEIIVGAILVNRETAHTQCQFSETWRKRHKHQPTRTQWQRGRDTDWLRPRFDRLKSQNGDRCTLEEFHYLPGPSWIWLGNTETNGSAVDSSEGKVSFHSKYLRGWVLVILDMAYFQNTFFDYNMNPHCKVGCQQMHAAEPGRNINSYLGLTFKDMTNLSMTWFVLRFNLG